MLRNSFSWLMKGCLLLLMVLSLFTTAQTGLTISNNHENSNTLIEDSLDSLMPEKPFVNEDEFVNVPDTSSEKTEYSSIPMSKNPLNSRYEESFSKKSIDEERNFTPWNSLVKDYKLDYEITEETDFSVEIIEERIKLIVGFHKTVNFNKINFDLELHKTDSQLIRHLNGINAFVAEVPVESLDKFIDYWSSLNFVRYVEPSMIVSIDGSPNDPDYPDQWGPQKIMIEEAWDIETGDFSNVLVCVIDTGIDYNHPDLSAQYMTSGYDWYNDDNDPMDDHSHGTHCAGTIAATINNSVGVVGLANVKIMAEKFLSSGGYGSTEHAASAIIHAVDAGADILSNSWGSSGPSGVLEDALVYAASRDVVIIGAAGNSGSDNPHYPSAYSEVISVSATDINDELASFSNYGETIEIAAPGVDILSTVLDNDYDYFSGTSMACPHVAGVAALIRSQFPGWNADSVRTHLQDTTDDLGELGWDEYYGYGRVNAFQAVQPPPAHNLKAYVDSPSALVPGSSVNITFTIYNHGMEEEGPVYLHLIINDTTVMSVTTPSISSRAYLSCSHEWTPTTLGTYNITAYVEAVPDESFLWDNSQSKFSLVSNPIIDFELGDYVLMDWYVDFTMFIEYYYSYSMNFTYLEMIDDSHVNATYFGDDNEAWVSVNIVNRKIEGGTGIQGYWMTQIETDIVNGSEINWEVETGVVVGSVTYLWEGIPIEAWNVSVFDGFAYNYYDKETGIWLHFHSEIQGADLNDTSMLTFNLPHEVYASIKLSNDESLIPEEPLLIDAFVKNIGESTESDVELSLIIDDVEVSNKTFSTLTSGEKGRLQTFEVVLTTGTHNITIYTPLLGNENYSINNVETHFVEVLNVSNYHWYESDYSWYDAATYGYKLGISGDDTYGNVSLPFTFNYYNEDFDTVYISSNGWLSFANSEPSTFWTPGFPTKEHPFSIALFWEDMKAEDNIYVWSTSDFLVIEYLNYNYSWGSYAGTFEIVFFPNGTMLFQYESTGSNYGTTVGTNYGYNQYFYTLYPHGLSYINEKAIFITTEERPGTVNGTIKDTSLGDPIVNASIDIYRYVPWGKTLVNSTNTDISGEYSLEVPVDDDYWIIAHCNNCFANYTSFYFDPVYPNFETTIDFNLLSHINGSTAIITFVDWSTMSPLENVKVFAYYGEYAEFDHLNVTEMYSNSSGKIKIENIPFEHCHFFNASLTGYEVIVEHYLGYISHNSEINFTMLMIPIGFTQDDANTGDDAGDSISETTEISTGVYNGSYANSTSDFQDWYNFTLNDFGILTVELSSYDIFDADYDLFIFDESEELIEMSNLPSWEVDMVSVIVIPGTYYIEAEYYSGAMAKYNLSITFEPRDPDLLLSFIEVNVEDSDIYVPIQNAEVQIYDIERNITEVGYTDIDGFLNITGLLTGDYELSITADGYYSEYSSVWIYTIGKRYYRYSYLDPVPEPEDLIINSPSAGTTIEGSIVLIDYSLTNNESLDDITVYVNGIFVTVFENLNGFQEDGEFFVPVFENGTNIIRLQASWSTGATNTTSVSIVSSNVVPYFKPRTGDYYNMTLESENYSCTNLMYCDFNYTFGEYFNEFEINITLYRTSTYNDSSYTFNAIDWMKVNILNGYISDTSPDLLVLKYQHFWPFVHFDSSSSLGDKSPFSEWNEIIVIDGEATWYGLEIWTYELQNYTEGSHIGQAVKSNGMVIRSDINNTNFNQIWYITAQTFITDNNIPIITDLADITIEESSVNNKLSWNVSDNNPLNYVIYKNNEEVFSDLWTSNSVIIYDLDDLPIGTYNITIIIFDHFGNSATDTLIVTVADLISPTLSHPIDVIYTVGDTGYSIAWNATDTNPGTYYVLRDSIEIVSGSWISNTSIVVNVDMLPIGVYTFTLVVTDANGNTASDSVQVIVETDQTTTSTSESSTSTSTQEFTSPLPTLPILVSMLSIGVVFVIRRRRIHK